MNIAIFGGSFDPVHSEHVNIVKAAAERLNADKIIVLDEGKMVGMGTHRELMQTCPVYQEIARSQLSREELGA